MGTRNLTMVIDKEGQTKVAQYGQWDGYPSGVGVGVLAFLNDKNLMEKLEKNLTKVRFLDQEGRDKDFIDSYNKNTPQWSNEPDNRTDEQKKWWTTYMTRDLAEEILTNIANSEDAEILIADRSETAKSDGMVEYCYIINLKENTFAVHNTIDTDAIIVYKLDELPTKEEFLKLEEVEE